MENERVTFRLVELNESSNEFEQQVYTIQNEHKISQFLYSFFLTSLNKYLVSFDSSSKTIYVIDAFKNSLICKTESEEQHTLNSHKIIIPNTDHFLHLDDCSLVYFEIDGNNSKLNSHCLKTYESNAIMKINGNYLMIWVDECLELHKLDDIVKNKRLNENQIVLDKLPKSNLHELTIVNDAGSKSSSFYLIMVQTSGWIRVFKYTNNDCIKEVGRTLHESPPSGITGIVKAYGKYFSFADLITYKIIE